ncbi:CopD family protein [Mycolicibacterium sp. XJ1819]
MAGGALVVVVASVTAWALAHPQGALGATLVRAFADCAAVVTLGLAVVPVLDDARHRDELRRRAGRPLTAAAEAWLVAELARLIVTAAAVAGVPVQRLGLNTAMEFAVYTSAGRAGLIGVAAAAVVGIFTLVPRSASTGVVVIGAAAAGVAARALTGHFAHDAVAGAAVAIHTLAAALWCGALAGLVLTVGYRGQWARVLPRFSQLSLGCVLALLIAGATAGIVGLGSPAALLTTGYGRVLTAKIVVTVALVVFGWRNRTIWLPAARTHRATAVVSRSRSLTELAGMAVALALAAGLAVTG